MSQTTLRVEIEPVGGKGNSATPTTFNDIKRQQDEATQKFKQDAEDYRRRTGVGGVADSARQTFDKNAYRKRLGADRQERDEGWLDRQNIRERKRALAQQKRDEDWYERDQARAKRQKLSQQKRDEDYADRQGARDYKQKVKEKTNALRQQARDEDWFARDQARLRNQKWWNNPSNVANWVNNRQVFASQVRTHQQFQRLGFSQNSRITSSVARLTSGFTRLSGVMGVLSGVGTLLYRSWKSSQETLLKEGERVRRFSPSLQLQNMVNRFRELHTDQVIAARYSDQMVEASDRQSRWDNTWRLVGAKAAASFNDSPFGKMFNGIKEGLLWLAELYVGSSEIAADSNATLKRILGVSEEQLKEMGLKSTTRDALAAGLKNAENVVKALGGGDLDLQGMAKQADFDISRPNNQNNPGLLGFAR